MRRSILTTLLFKQTRWVLILLVTFWLTACTSESRSDADFLKSQPCPAPCWQGITPGITDEGAALAIISDATLVEQDSIRAGVNEDDPSRSGYSFRRVGAGGGAIGLKEGVVSGIQVNLATELMLEDVLVTFGAPDYIWIDHYSDQEIVKNCYRSYLYDVENGIRLLVNVCDQDNSYYEYLEGKARIHPENQVSSLVFMEPKANPETLLMDSLFSDVDYARRIIDDAHPWTGYGFYPVAE